MAITPIALGVQVPKFADPMESYGNVLKLQSMQQQNALAGTQMAELERQRSQNALLNEAYGRAINPQTGALDYNALVSELARGGQGSLVPGIRKAESEGIEAQFKARGAEQKYALDFLDATRRQLTPGMSLESVLAISRATHKDPVMGRLLNQMGVDPARTEAETIAAFNAGRGDEHILAMALGAEKFAENIKMLDVGGEYRRQLPGGRVEKEGIPKTLTPEQVAVGNRADRQFGLEQEKFAYQKEKDRGELPEDEKARLKARGESQAKFEIAAPQAIADANQAIGLIDQMVGSKTGEIGPHPGLGEAVGFGFGTRFVPGTPAASFQALFDQVQGGAFLQAYEALRGGGAITEKEGQKATSARNRMSLAQSESEFIKAAREFQDVLRTGIRRAESRAAGGTGTESQAPSAAEPKKIISDAEYNQLPKGALFIGPDGKTRRKP